VEDVERDRQRAEVFDALGHPTRITILKTLSEGSMGFADLKKRIGIDSSGHLQHHLNKLDGLIKTDEHGKYCLSDQGKDALLTVQTVEKTAGSVAFTPEIVAESLLMAIVVLVGDLVIFGLGFLQLGVTVLIIVLFVMLRSLYQLTKMKRKLKPKARSSE
jgi:DNA-binding HxlR family transcriptional regulator